MRFKRFLNFLKHQPNINVSIKVHQPTAMIQPRTFLTASILNDNNTCGQIDFQLLEIDNYGIRHLIRSAAILGETLAKTLMNMCKPILDHSFATRIPKPHFFQGKRNGLFEARGSVRNFAVRNFFTTQLERLYTYRSGSVYLG